MTYLIIAASILLPIFMFYTEKRFSQLKYTYHFLALLSILIFGNIAALSIYQVIMEKTLFMTTIHGIFLNPFFVISGAYLGLYVLYQMLCLVLKNDKVH